MKLKLPILLQTALLSAASIGHCLAADPVYEDQASQTLNADLIQTVTGNWAYRGNGSGIALDGGSASYGQPAYEVSFKGSTGGEHLLFDGNKTGIKSKYSSFESLKSLIFKNHDQTALSIDFQDYPNRRGTGLVINNIEYVEFSQNDVDSQSVGGAIYVLSGSAEFKNIKKFLLNNNSGYYNGGAINLSGDLLFYNVAYLQANNNTMNGIDKGGESGGALGIQNSSNSSATRFINNGTIEFKENKVIAGKTAQFIGGGAILARCELSFMGNGDIIFHDNMVDDRNAMFPQYTANGGAIRVLNRVFLDTDDPNTHRVDFSADRGDIEFKGNRIYRKKAWGDLPCLNSVAAQAHQFNVRAQGGREVRFYDPIDVTLVSAHDNTHTVDAIYFNAPETNDEIVQKVYGGTAPEFTGTIRFSGEYTEDVIIQGAEESDSSFADRLFWSRHSQLKGDLYVEGGVLVIEHKASLGRIMEGFDYTTYAPGDIEADIVYSASLKDQKMNFNKGIVQMTTGGTIVGPNVNIDGSVVWRTDGTGHMVSQAIDWSQGAVHDFDYSLRNAVAPVVGADGYALISNGVITYTNTLSLGGDIKVADDSRTYARSDWKGNKKFLVLSDVKGSREGSDYDGILSTVANSPVVDSPYTYKGTWSIKWEDDDLYAYWTYNDDAEEGGGEGGGGEEGGGGGGDIEDVDPELMGELTENSLWMTGSNLKTLSRTIQRQMGMSRIYDRKCNNFWFEGLGDFINQSNKGATDGFDYNGGGYAIGYDTRLCPDSSMLGVSFGQLAGTGKNRRMSGSIDQNTVMANVYGGYIKELNNRLTYSLTGTVGHGRSHNKMHTVYTSGANTYADWNNDAWMVDIVSTWDYKWNESWTVSPFIGLEWTRASHGTFTEWGHEDYRRHFDSADMSYLRMPVGLTFKNLQNFSNNRFWMNSLSVSYLPDVYRQDPNGKANALINDFIWDVKSASPARNALRVEANSYYRFSEKWGVYAGYSIEARSRSTYQQVNLGMNVTF